MMCLLFDQIGFVKNSWLNLFNLASASLIEFYFCNILSAERTARLIAVDFALNNLTWPSFGSGRNTKNETKLVFFNEIFIGSQNNSLRHVRAVRLCCVSLVNV